MVVKYCIEVYKAIRFQESHVVNEIWYIQLYELLFFVCHHI